MDYVNVGAPGGLNGFQRRLVHQLVRNEFPTCRTFARSGGEFMQVEKADPVKEAQVSYLRNSSTVLTVFRSPSQNYILLKRTLPNKQVRISNPQ
jgi:hypothetical protein